VGGGWIYPGVYVEFPDVCMDEHVGACSACKVVGFGLGHHWACCRDTLLLLHQVSHVLCRVAVEGHPALCAVPCAGTSGVMS
jgi:hypothetical protein